MAEERTLAIAATGAANLASVQALCARAHVRAMVSSDPEVIFKAEKALLPGVGAFGAAVAQLARTGLDKAIKARVEEKKPTMGICLGMQMFFDGSEESPGSKGIGAIRGEVGKIRSFLPLPQLGWNRVRPNSASSFVCPGWAYFANSYRVRDLPEDFSGTLTTYGEDFYASLERYASGADVPFLLLCQFHPELSGPWGLDLFSRWMEDRKSPKATIAERCGQATAMRIIPCLDIKGGRVVKGVKFENLVDSGDPAALAARYEAEGADEIALLDISATLEERKTALESVRAVRAAISVPISVGGGIKGVGDAARLLEAGADRVSVNSAAVRDPRLLSALAERFGVQCVVAAIDARRRISPAGGWEVVIDAGKRVTGLDAVAWAARCAALGAGEILLTSIDRDGTGLGYDEALVKAIADAAPIPVIASGGATNEEHFLAGARAGARAVLGAGAFHRGELSILAVKEYLGRNGVEVRL
ncbi:MAG: histidinol dehydrogenase [Spirochaetes bacterium]|nr:MAG: histidinol dehydrogenase [Spirochaetota bacterium]